MGRMYSLQFENVAVTAVQDFFQLEANTVPAIVHAIYLSQYTDVGDAAAEALRITLNRATDALTNVTAEQALDPGDAAALADCNVNDTTRLTTGLAVLHAENWNIAMPFVFLPPPELRPIVEVGNVFTCSLLNAPADSITMSGTLYFEEIGG